VAGAEMFVEKGQVEKVALVTTSDLVVLAVGAPATGMLVVHLAGIQAFEPLPDYRKSAALERV
jgi:hypothetical protein